MLATVRYTFKKPWRDGTVALVLEPPSHAIAIDPTGALLAIAGSSSTGPDLFMLDARTGRVEAEANLSRMVTAAAIAKEKSVRVEALAFHPSGWLAAATNAGVVVELHASGETSAFRGASRAITSLVFVAEGRSLIVAGAEPQLRVWPVDVGGDEGVQMTIIDDPEAKKRTPVISTRGPKRA